MASTTAPPGKYASNTDLTPSLTAFTWSCLVIASLAMAGRCSARYSNKAHIGVDDVFAVAGYIGLIATLVPMLLMASIGAVGLDPLTTMQKGEIVGLHLGLFLGYVFTLSFGKLSLLFLYRRIFGMREFWFRTVWWCIFVSLFPIWIVVVFTEFGLVATRDNSGKTDNLTAIYNVVTEGICGLTNLGMLVLPLASVWNLQLDTLRKIGLTFVFTLGSLGSAVSFVRTGRDIDAIMTNWDPRYKTYEKEMLVAAEVTTLILCASLPLLPPVLVKIKDFTWRSILGISQRSSLLRSASNRSASKSTQASSAGNVVEDDEVKLKNTALNHTNYFDIESISEFEFHTAEIIRVESRRP